MSYWFSSVHPLIKAQAIDLIKRLTPEQSNLYSPPFLSDLPGIVTYKRNHREGKRGKASSQLQLDKSKNSWGGLSVVKRKTQPFELRCFDF